jgi:hypothetical protein
VPQWLRQGSARVIKEVRRRADRLGDRGDPSAAHAAQADAAALGSYGYPVGGDADHVVAMAYPDGLEDAPPYSAPAKPTQNHPPYSAVFVATAETVDRDGDVVRVQGVNTDEWERAGAPVFFGHQSHPYPIGSCIDPESGSFDWWPDPDRGLVRCRIHFDTGDPVGRFCARKVSLGLMRAVSVAFVPRRAHRRDAHSSKAGAYHDHPAGAPPGWDFEEADMTELSLVGVGSNPLALLEGAPPAFRKAWTFCKGGRCYAGCHTTGASQAFDKDMESGRGSDIVYEGTPVKGKPDYSVEERDNRDRGRGSQGGSYWVVVDSQGREVEYRGRDRWRSETDAEQVADILNNGPPRLGRRSLREGPGKATADPNGVGPRKPSCSCTAQGKGGTACRCALAAKVRRLKELTERAVLVANARRLLDLVNKARRAGLLGR